MVSAKRSRLQTPKSPKKAKSRFTIIEFPVFSNYWIHAEFASDIAAATKKYPSTECVGEETLDTYEALTIHVEENCSFIFLQLKAHLETIFKDIEKEMETLKHGDSDVSLRRINN